MTDAAADARPMQPGSSRAGFARQDGHPTTPTDGPALPQAPAPAGPQAAAPVQPPATPARILAYGAASLLFGTAQGLGSNIVSANLPAVQAAFAATPSEAAWLTAAYYATSATASLLLLKFRLQYGIRVFATLGLILFVVVAFAHLFIHDLRSAVVVRGAFGIAAAPLGSLSLLYMIEPFPPESKFTAAFPFGVMGAQTAIPLARLISPRLLDIDLWGNLTVLELGLALACLATVHLLPLAYQPRGHAFDRLDALSFPLLGLGLGLLSVGLSLARLYWWGEAPWLGLCFAAAVACLALVVAIEVNRERPMLHFRWLSTPELILFAGSLFVVRFLITEQTTGAIGLLQSFGLLNDHLMALNGAVLVATAAGYATCSLFNRPGNRVPLHAVALLLIAAGALLDSRATSLTGPDQMLLSQSMISFGGGLFLPPAVAWGFTTALARGRDYLMSFFAVYLVSQTTGALLSQAAMGTFEIVREKFHSNVIAGRVTLLDPIAAARVRAGASSLSATLTDPALRSAEGVARLSAAATREATVLAYDDLFLVVGWVALGSLALMLAQAAWTWLQARAASSRAASSRTTSALAARPAV